MATESGAGAVSAGLRNSVVYAGASGLQRGIVFLLLPVYTRALDPAAYGELSVLLALAAVGIILLSFGMEQSFFRTYFRLRDNPVAQRRFVGAAWSFLIVVPVGLVAVLSAAAAPFTRGGSLVSVLDLTLALAGAAAFVSATIVPLAVLRADERLRDYVVLALVATASTAAFTLIGVVVLDGGVSGWLAAVLVANLVSFLAALVVVPVRPARRFALDELRPALRLGLPLVPHQLSHWGLGLSNRLLLAGMVSTSKVGIYALAMNVALPVVILVQGLSQGFMAAYARAADDVAAQAALRRVVTVQVTVVLAVTTIGALLGPLAVRVLAPAEYSDAIDLVPWLVLGYGCLGLYFVPMNVVSLTVGRTTKVWTITLLAAAANVVSLLVLVPVIDLDGAVIATAVGYAVLLVGVAAYSRGPDNPVTYDARSLLAVGCIFGLSYAAGVLLSGNETVADALVRSACIAAALPMLVAAGVLKSPVSR